ncbi:MAG: hypothetical protein ACE5F6_15285 [Anaerolineae bacterium]
MIHIELTREEAQTLHRILQSDLSDLRMEIAGTEQKDFREFLKAREVFLKELLRQLEQQLERQPA